MKLWDLRSRKVLREYGEDDDVQEVGLYSFHSDSIWDIKPNSSFESAYTCGRDGKIFYTDLAGDHH